MFSYFAWHSVCFYALDKTPTSPCFEGVALCISRLSVNLALALGVLFLFVLEPL